MDFLGLLATFKQSLKKTHVILNAFGDWIRQDMPPTTITTKRAGTLKDQPSVLRGLNLTGCLKKMRTPMFPRALPNTNSRDDLESSKELPTRSSAPFSRKSLCERGPVGEGKQGKDVASAFEESVAGDRRVGS